MASDSDWLYSSCGFHGEEAGKGQAQSDCISPCEEELSAARVELWVPGAWRRVGAAGLASPRAPPWTHHRDCCVWKQGWARLWGDAAVLLAGRGRGVGCWNQNTGKTWPREEPLLCAKEKKKIDHTTSILTIWGVDLKIQSKFLFLEKAHTSDFAKQSVSRLITAGWGQHGIGTRICGELEPVFLGGRSFLWEETFLWPLVAPGSRDGVLGAGT